MAPWTVLVFWSLLSPSFRPTWPITLLRSDNCVARIVRIHSMFKTRSQCCRSAAVLLDVNVVFDPWLAACGHGKKRAHVLPSILLIPSVLPFTRSIIIMPPVFPPETENASICLLPATGIIY